MPRTSWRDCGDRSIGPDSWSTANTDRVAFGIGTNGSRSTVIGGCQDDPVQDLDHAGPVYPLTVWDRFVAGPSLEGAGFQLSVPTATKAATGLLSFDHEELVGRGFGPNLALRPARDSMNGGTAIFQGELA
jgi:hypothetical protein